MLNRFSIFRRKPIRALATSWCVVAALPAFAGRPEPDGPRMRASIEPVELPELVAPAATKLLAAAKLPAESGDAAAEPNLIAAAGVSADAPAVPAPAPTSNVTINLINRMVARGLLPKEDADELIKQAEADAALARAQSLAVEHVAAQVAEVRNGPPELDPYAGQETMNVTYIPEAVRAQLRDEIRQEVMAQARAENWAAPRTLPEWTTRIRLFGDVRVRGEGIFYPNGNDNTGAFPNFNAINTGAPFDVAGTVFSPQLNVDQDRTRIRLRVRLGLEAELGEGFTIGLRIGTGDSNTPVSTNQSLGLANQGQGGNFSKYALWLDRGYIRYQLGSEPNKQLSLSLGRFDNPFFTTSEIIWDDDLGFDGIALQTRYEVLPGVVPFLNGGAFPVFNTDLNFSSNQPAKFKSSDKWLYGAQFGVDWKIHKDFSLKLAAAYYQFDNVEGQLSDPFIPLSKDDAGNTDNTRPSFAQKGNTYRPLRRIISSPLNNFGTTNQFQYFGLATPFHEFALSGRLDINRWEPFQISIFGEWVKNLAFDQNAIEQIAVNNRGPNNAIGGVGKFAGGDTAWIFGIKAGAAVMQKAGDWQVGVSYRYVESDSMVDGFVDSDFGLGGTNLKGYSVFGSVAVSPRISVGLRWMSAQEVAGPPLKIDVLMLDVNGKF